MAARRGHDEVVVRCPGRAASEHSNDDSKRYHGHHSSRHVSSSDSLAHGFETQAGAGEGGRPAVTDSSLQQPSLRVISFSSLQTNDKAEPVTGNVGES
jgi:hypothetical protein